MTRSSVAGVCPLAFLLLLLVVFCSSVQSSSSSSSIVEEEAPPQQPQPQRRRELNVIDDFWKAISDTKNGIKEGLCDPSANWGYLYDKPFCCGITQETKTMFVTSNEYPADITSIGYEPGFPGVDRLCTDAANAAGLPGSYWAYVTLGGYPPIDFFKHQGSYVRPDGKELFQCAVDMYQGGETPVSLWMDEYGKLITSSTPVPTNTNEYGRLFFNDDGKKKGGYYREKGEVPYEYEQALDVRGVTMEQVDPTGDDTLLDDDYYNTDDYYGERGDFGDCLAFTYDTTKGDEFDPVYTPIGITNTAVGLRPNTVVSCNKKIRLLCVQV